MHCRKLVVVLALLGLDVAGVPLHAQAPTASTRFTVAVAPMYAQPKGEFHQNVRRGFGGGGALLYRLDQSGFLSLRFDGSGFAYGREKRTVPFSETVGGRVEVDVTTTNSFMAFSFGPEITVPRGPIRPYLNTGFSGLWLSTGSSVGGFQSSDGGDASIGTTNFSDATRALILGGGVTIPLKGIVSLDTGVRYHRGGQASYLLKGGIQDNPDGSITVAPINTRTPYMVYLIGVRIRIPYDSPNPCPRFVC